jgi:hypothetical protein
MSKDQTNACAWILRAFPTWRNPERPDHTAWPAALRLGSPKSITLAYAFFKNVARLLLMYYLFTICPVCSAFFTPIIQCSARPILSFIIYIYNSKACVIISFSAELSREEKELSNKPYLRDQCHKKIWEQQQLAGFGRKIIDLFSIITHCMFLV